MFPARARCHALHEEITARRAADGPEIALFRRQAERLAVKPA
jgi:hypothetical protein